MIKYEGELNHEKTIKFDLEKDSYIFDTYSNIHELIICCKKDGQLKKYSVNTTSLLISEPSVSKLPEDISNKNEIYYKDHLIFAAKKFYPNKFNDFENYNLLYRINFKTGDYYSIPINVSGFLDAETDIISIQAMPDEKEI